MFCAGPESSTSASINSVLGQESVLKTRRDVPWPWEFTRAASSRRESLTNVSGDALHVVQVPFCFEIVDRNTRAGKDVMEIVKEKTFPCPLKVVLRILVPIERGQRRKFLSVQQL